MKDELSVKEVMRRLLVLAFIGLLLLVETGIPLPLLRLTDICNILLHNATLAILFIEPNKQWIANFNRTTLTRKLIVSNFSV